jgi:hypothetical protein
MVPHAQPIATRVRLATDMERVMVMEHVCAVAILGVLIAVSVIHLITALHVIFFVIPTLRAIQMGIVMPPGDALVEQNTLELLVTCATLTSMVPLA